MNVIGSVPEERTEEVGSNIHIYYVPYKLYVHGLISYVLTNSLSETVLCIVKTA